METNDIYAPAAGRSIKNMISFMFINVPVRLELKYILKEESPYSEVHVGIDGIMFPLVGTKFCSVLECCLKTLKWFRKCTFKCVDENLQICSINKNASFCVWIHFATSISASWYRQCLCSFLTNSSELGQIKRVLKRLFLEQLIEPFENLSSSSVSCTELDKVIVYSLEELITMYFPEYMPFKTEILSFFVCCDNSEVFVDLLKEIQDSQFTFVLKNKESQFNYLLPDEKPQFNCVLPFNDISFPRNKLSFLGISTENMPTLSYNSNEFPHLNREYFNYILSVNKKSFDFSNIQKQSTFTPLLSPPSEDYNSETAF